ncbi:hypothetical protein R1sor_018936 [Riccia sorocarpa]|uniref:Reverse transcriptase zinc-binding domain-containing protein n=1 Tax=Riccia sorocarpa TaxID=122646 RepID=A0ABD3ICU5_9MARC
MARDRAVTPDVELKELEAEMLRLLQEPTEDWMIALGTIIKKVVSTGNWARAMRLWNMEEVLLARCPTRIDGARVMTGLITVWKKVSRHLTLLQNEMTGEGSTNTEVYLAIGEQQEWFSTQIAKEMKAQHRKHRIHTIGKWADWAAEKYLNSPLNREECAVVEAGLMIYPESNPIQSLPWNWKMRKRRGEWRTLTTQKCKALLAPNRGERLPLNKKWNRVDTNRQWNRRLQRLWKNTIPSREKLWLWKAIQQGMPTLDRIQKFGHADGFCKRSHNKVETAEHLWWNCVKTKAKWRDYRFLTEGLECTLNPANSFISAIDGALKGQNPNKSLPFVFLTKAIWLERNAATYSQRQTSIPVKTSMQNALDTIGALQQKNEACTKAYRRLQASRSPLQRAIDRASTHLEDSTGTANAVNHEDDKEERTENEDNTNTEGNTSSEDSEGDEISADTG